MKTSTWKEHKELPCLYTVRQQIRELESKFRLPQLPRTIDHKATASNSTVHLSLPTWSIRIFPIFTLGSQGVCLSYPFVPQPEMLVTANKPLSPSNKHQRLMWPNMKQMETDGNRGKQSTESHKKINDDQRESRSESPFKSLLFRHQWIEMKWVMKPMKPQAPHCSMYAMRFPWPLRNEWWRRHRFCGWIPRLCQWCQWLCRIPTLPTLPTDAGMTGMTCLNWISKSWGYPQNHSF